MTLYAKWTVQPSLASSDKDGTIYTGGRAVLSPNIDGGIWEWDESFFSASLNSPATFTALKSGTSIITYTVGSVSTSYKVTINESELPFTGQDFTWAYLLFGLGLLAAVGALMFKKHAARIKIAYFHISI